MDYATDTKRPGCIDLHHRPRRRIGIGVRDSHHARISHSGLGAIKLGMTERQIERAAKRPITLSSARGSDCALATLAPKTQGLFTNRRLRRIYVQTRRFATENGIRVGATEKRVLAAYPDMLARVPQKFANEDNLVLSKDNRRLVFSLAGGKISEISTGRTPEINLVERCS
jgi:hypothetical protein